MPRRRHDSLSKDLLTFWLDPLGRVESPRRVQGEERQLDLLFVAKPSGRTENTYRRHLGLLGQMARGVAGLEAYRNPCSENEVRACVVKLVELHTDLLRRARRERRPAATVPLPHLWALTPSASEALLETFGARPYEGFPVGFWALPRGFGVALVAADRLPPGPETLWLRLLGRDQVQRQALEELDRLPERHPLRRATVVRVLRWRAEALERPRPTQADRELIMNSERWVQQWERRLLRQGKAEGLAEGKAEGLAEGKAEGLVEGKAEGLRQAVVLLCDAFGIVLSPARRARLEAMAAGELEALCLAIKQARAWPETPASRRPTPRRTARTATPKAPAKNR